MSEHLSTHDHTALEALHSDDLIEIFLNASHPQREEAVRLLNKRRRADQQQENPYV